MFYLVFVTSQSGTNGNGQNLLEIDLGIVLEGSFPRIECTAREVGSGKTADRVGDYINCWMRPPLRTSSSPEFL